MKHFEQGSVVQQGDCVEFSKSATEDYYVDRWIIFSIETQVRVVETQKIENDNLVVLI